jgi:hypothetical protein
MSNQFNELMTSIEIEEKRLNQHVPEWRTFLEYAQGYFAAHGITRPIIVEIGILDGAQRRFYKNILNAEHVGIDIDANNRPDIIGDSQKLETRKKLEVWLAGRKIDLLFIDGWHTYEAVKSDYEMYGPLTRHIIAIHDIHTPPLDAGDPVDVRRLWNEILVTNKTDTIITIQHHNPRRLDEFNGRPLGIGVIVKDGGE